MFGSVILDVAIGLILVFLILSLVASAVREGIENWLKMRSRFLERGIWQLLDEDKGLVNALYANPHVAGLYEGTYDEARKANALPSYIPSRNFAMAMLDLAARGRDVTAHLEASADTPALSLATVRRNVARIGNPAVQRVVLTAVDTASGNMEEALKSIERWFDGTMDRVSGWYKRKTAKILLYVGLFVAVVTNVDTVRIAKSLYQDPGQRQAAVAMAGSIVQNQSAATTTPRTQTELTAISARLDSLKLPIGWPDRDWADAKTTWYGWTVSRLIGWLITAFAITLGAPFWFDVLNKFMVIRSTVKPREKSREEGSEDRQEKKTEVSVTTAQAATPTAVATSSGSAARAPAPPPFQPHEWAAGHASGGIL